ncbi:hypothetical protein Vretimale_6003 [Volvox reticuliferus]|uniref:Uncharacterized protein n=1 Tax=Volvox reticuliferus TaxID=1737510 RepID=A0A8J4G6Q7_9CHLO|nr:hypothetical protein Vretimale_6003 [Volvox reticuliferus]
MPQPSTPEPLLASVSVAAGWPAGARAPPLPPVLLLGASTSSTSSTHVPRGLRFAAVDFEPGPDPTVGAAAASGRRCVPLAAGAGTTRLPAETPSPGGTGSPAMTPSRIWWNCSGVRCGAVLARGSARCRASGPSVTSSYFTGCGGIGNGNHF